MRKELECTHFVDFRGRPDTRSSTQQREWNSQIFETGKLQRRRGRKGRAKSTSIVDSSGQTGPDTR